MPYLTILTLLLANDTLDKFKYRFSTGSQDSDLMAVFDWVKSQNIPTSGPCITAQLLVSESLKAMEQNTNSRTQYQNMPSIPRETLMLVSAINDFCLGANFTASSVIIAEDWLRLTQEKKVVDRLDNLPLDPVTYASVSSYMGSLAAREAELLEKDPTGRLLIEETVRYIKDNRSNLPMAPKYVILSFYLDGAEYAKEAYNIVYPVAQKLKDANQFT